MIHVNYWTLIFACLHDIKLTKTEVVQFITVDFQRVWRKNIQLFFENSSSTGPLLKGFTYKMLFLLKNTESRGNTATHNLKIFLRILCFRVVRCHDFHVFSWIFVFWWLKKYEFSRRYDGTQNDVFSFSKNLVLQNMGSTVSRILEKKGKNMKKMLWVPIGSRPQTPWFYRPLLLVFHVVHFITFSADGYNVTGEFR